MSDVMGDLKFDRDATMRASREALEATILAWPGVARKGMMGCLVYFRGKRFFAFLVTGGLVITKLPDADRAALAKRRGAGSGARPTRASRRTPAPAVGAVVQRGGRTIALNPPGRCPLELVHILRVSLP